MNSGHRTRTVLESDEYLPGDQKVHFSTDPVQTDQTSDTQHSYQQRLNSTQIVIFAINHKISSVQLQHLNHEYKTSIDLYLYNSISISANFDELRNSTFSITSLDEFT